MKLTAEQVLQAIEEMDSGERIKLLNELFYLYYNNRSLPRMDGMIELNARFFLIIFYHALHFLFPRYKLLREIKNTFGGKLT
ncbi:hypothetical protein [Cytobacillus sp. FSL H8-0458]|uniref:hypothetical protein n=1 Tax=Cytobacillus sp. FSL H8-0458 TaxID=2975346 RepID=UPI0030F8E042